MIFVIEICDFFCFRVTNYLYRSGAARVWNGFWWSCNSGSSSELLFGNGNWKAFSTTRRYCEKPTCRVRFWHDENHIRKRRTWEKPMRFSSERIYCYSSYERVLLSWSQTLLKMWTSFQLTSFMPQTNWQSEGCWLLVRFRNWRCFSVLGCHSQVVQKILSKTSISRLSWAVYTVPKPVCQRLRCVGFSLKLCSINDVKE